MSASSSSSSSSFILPQSRSHKSKRKRKRKALKRKLKNQATERSRIEADHSLSILSVSMRMADENNFMPDDPDAPARVTVGVVKAYTFDWLSYKPGGGRNPVTRHIKKPFKALITINQKISSILAPKIGYEFKDAQKTIQDIAGDSLLFLGVESILLAQGKISAEALMFCINKFVAYKMYIILLDENLLDYFYIQVLSK